MKPVACCGTDPELVTFHPREPVWGWGITSDMKGPGARAPAGLGVPTYFVFKGRLL